MLLESGPRNIRTVYAVYATTSLIHSSWTRILSGRQMVTWYFLRDPTSSTTWYVREQRFRIYLTGNCSTDQPRKSQTGVMVITLLRLEHQHLDTGCRPTFESPEFATLTAGGDGIDFPGTLFSCILAVHILTDQVKCTCTDQ